MAKFNMNSINWPRILLNLRSYAGTSTLKVSRLTEISVSKLYRAMNGGSYQFTDCEAHRLLDIHLDFCFVLHTPQRLIIQ